MKNSWGKVRGLSLTSCPREHQPWPVSNGVLTGRTVTAKYLENLLMSVISLKFGEKPLLQGHTVELFIYMIGV